MRYKSIIKRVIKTGFYCLVVIFSLIFTLQLILRSPSIQNLCARLLADYLSRELKTEFNIRGLSLSLRNGIVLDGVLVKDLHNDDLLKADQLAVRIKRISISKHILRIDRIFLKNATFQLLIHKNDSVVNLQFLIDYFSPRDTTKVGDTVPSPRWNLSVSTVDFRNVRFHFQDENKPLVTDGMDYTNIDVRNINLLIKDISIEEDTINADIRSLSALERSGFRIRSMSGKFRVSPAFLKAKDLKVITDNSSVFLDFEFLYDGWRGYTDFLNKVTIVTDIEPSVLNLRDIGYYAPDIKTMEDQFRFNGSIKGTVTNFSAKNFSCAFGRTTLFNGDIRSIGLPDVERTWVDMDIRQLRTNLADIELLKLPGGEGTIAMPELLKKAGDLNLTGRFTGYYNDFVANAVLTSSLGTLRSNLTLRKDSITKLLNYQGQLDATAFDIGKFLGYSTILGRVTLRTHINGSGVHMNDAELVVNARVDSVMINGYNYKDISLKGVYMNRSFDGDFSVSDPNMLMDFNGMIDLKDTIPNFDFIAKIYRAQLFNLHLLKRDSVCDLATCINVNFRGDDLDNILGSIKLTNTTYLEGANVISADNISLLATIDHQGNKSYHITSDFADADFTGHFSFSKLVPSLVAFINNYIASFTMSESSRIGQEFAEQVLNYRVRVKESDEVTRVFLPFLKVAPNTLLEGYYNEEKEILTMKGNSDLMTLFGFQLSHWYIDAKTLPDNLFIETGSRELSLHEGKKTDTLVLSVDSLHIGAHMHHDSILCNVGWIAEGRRSHIAGYASFANDPQVEFGLRDFLVYLDHRAWSIAPNNRVVVDSSIVSINHVDFHSGDQYLTISGNISENPYDTLRIGFNQLDVSRVDMLLGNPSLDFDGILSGEVRITDIFHSFLIFSNLTLRNFRFNGESLGDATFNVAYNNAASKFDVRSQILYTGNVGTNIPFSMVGSFYTKPDPKFDFDINLKNLNLRMVQPFVSSFMSGLNGLASGNLHLAGTPAEPKLEGKIKLMRTEFRISYLNVGYSLADVVTVTPASFNFDKITVYDSLGNKAILNGQITHKNFSDIRLDLNIQAVDFYAFHNKPSQNNIFYGAATATGNVRIHGPLDNIHVDATAFNGKNTHVYIPINLTASVGQNDYIIFRNRSSDSLAALGETYVPKGNLSLNLMISANTDATIEVFFPEQLGNIKANGYGNLSMTMSPTNDFAINGTYFITKGSFLFQMKNLLRLPFSIKDGSRISWTGDPVNAILNLSAGYKTKVSLSGITSDPEYQSVRIPVETVVHLKGNLVNPDISFSINLPNVEEQIKTMVYAAIDTNNAAETSSQAISILVMNEFKPVTTTTTNVSVGTTSLAIVTNQINSLLSQISKNVNVGINYHPASSTSNQEFDVAFSTQFLDDRLLIDGAFGMNSYVNSSQQASTIVGDINIEYILTKDRRLRLRAFNRTNNIDVLNNNSPYTQGVGISYRRDFSTLRELFTKSKKKQTPKEKQP